MVSANLEIVVNFQGNLKLGQPNQIKNSIKRYHYAQGETYINVEVWRQMLSKLYHVIICKGFN